MTDYLAPPARPRLSWQVKTLTAALSAGAWWVGWRIGWWLVS